MSLPTVFSFKTHPFFIILLKFCESPENIIVPQLLKL